MPGWTKTSNITQNVKCKLFFIFKGQRGCCIEASDVIMSAEVIEAVEVFRTTKILKINNLLARITLF